MKLRLIIRIGVIISVILLCTGIGVYSYFRMNAVEHRRDFNLYTLVPQNAMAVLETDRMVSLVEDINRLHCSRDNRFLYISELFVYLKEYLHTLEEDTPHGLSREMNKMLLSFHEPDNPMNQVLYCALGVNDTKLLDTFIRKYSSNRYPSKTFRYRGEEIAIYPMADGKFLAAYFTRDFLVLSFQKRLVEQVIDAYKEKTSLMHLSSFCDMYTGKHARVAATVYLHLDSVRMGHATQVDTLMQAAVGGWTEFDLNLKENIIYCSGFNHDMDSTDTFINVLRRQQPAEGFPGDLLPASTFYYNRLAVSDYREVCSFLARQGYRHMTCADENEEKKPDEAWLSYLETYATGPVTTCLFQSPDSSAVPCAVAIIPLKPGSGAERALRALLYGISAPAMQARIYNHHLLLAPDGSSLTAYINALHKGEVLDGTPLYEEAISNLSPTYGFMQMVDLEPLLTDTNNYTDVLPNFFFRHAKFFRHFQIGIQLTSAEGTVCPNIILLYKNER